jgi:heme/copper-type cytochrome/quinol oxidase subunit 1
MIVIGLLVLLLATLEHRSAIHALQTQYPETKPYAHIHRSLAVVLAALVSVLGLLALLSTFYSSQSRKTATSDCLFDNALPWASSSTKDLLHFTIRETAKPAQISMSWSRCVIRATKTQIPHG